MHVLYSFLLRSKLFCAYKKGCSFIGTAFYRYFPSIELDNTIYNRKPYTRSFVFSTMIDTKESIKYFLRIFLIHSNTCIFDRKSIIFMWNKDISTIFIVADSISKKVWYENSKMMGIHGKFWILCYIECDIKFFVFYFFLSNFYDFFDWFSDVYSFYIFSFL